MNSNNNSTYSMLSPFTVFSFVYRHWRSIAALVFVLVFTACSDDEKDTAKPSILGVGTASSVVNPVNCQLYHRGDTIHFFYVFEDDTELGSFNIEVHDNSDHHSHSTESNDHNQESGECTHSEEHHHDADEHAAEQHWVYNQVFEIPAGQRRYEARVDIPIPLNIAEGDYHFMIRVTDRSGWMQLKALAIMIED